MKCSWREGNKIQLLENGKLIEISPDTLAGLKEPRA